MGMASRVKHIALPHLYVAVKSRVSHQRPLLPRRQLPLKPANGRANSIAYNGSHCNPDVRCFTAGAHCAHVDTDANTGSDGYAQANPYPYGFTDTDARSQTIVSTRPSALPVGRLDDPGELGPGGGRHLLQDLPRRPSRLRLSPGPGGESRFCELLADKVPVTTYVHTSDLLILDDLSLHGLTAQQSADLY